MILMFLKLSDFQWKEGSNKIQILRIVKTEQLLKKRRWPDDEGYFIFESFAVPKAITAISDSGLEIIFNLTQR